MNLINNFDALFSAFSQSGNRYNLLPKLTATAKAAGLSAEDIIDRAHDAGVTNRDADIRRLWNGSTIDPSRRATGWRPSRRPHPAQPQKPPKMKREFVPVTLRELGRGATSATIRQLSPVPIPSAIDPHEEASLQLCALDAGYDYKLWAGTILDKDFAKEHHRRVKTGGIWDALDLAERIRTDRRLELPTHVSMNPLSGREGLTTEGKPSLDCKATVAAFKFALIEFDHLALDVQAEIVMGMIRHPMLSVVTATYSGGKSIHTLLRLPDCPDEKTYSRHWAKLAAHFASADDPCFRIDLAPATHPELHLRLAGAVRPETGKRQRLLYCAQHDPTIF